MDSSRAKNQQMEPLYKEKSKKRNFVLNITSLMSSICDFLLMWHETFNFMDGTVVFPTLSNSLLLNDQEH